jgi:O-acetyl-ADP-ribose deacetylase (regulator of RNase III)
MNAYVIRNALVPLVMDPLETYALPGVGLFGFPVEKAAHVALRAVREWLDNDDGRNLESVVLCCWQERDAQLYAQILPVYFPASAVVVD